MKSVEHPANTLHIQEMHDIYGGVAPPSDLSTVGLGIGISLTYRIPPTPILTVGPPITTMYFDSVRIVEAILGAPDD